MKRSKKVREKATRRARPPATATSPHIDPLLLVAGACVEATLLGACVQAAARALSYTPTQDETDVAVAAWALYGAIEEARPDRAKGRA